VETETPFTKRWLDAMKLTNQAERQRVSTFLVSDRDARKRYAITGDRVLNLLMVESLERNDFASPADAPWSSWQSFYGSGVSNFSLYRSAKRHGLAANMDGSVNVFDVSNNMEAALGFLYLEHGLSAARQFFETYHLSSIEYRDVYYDWMKDLELYCLRRFNAKPFYEVTDWSNLLNGGVHRKFSSTVRLSDVALGMERVTPLRLTCCLTTVSVSQLNTMSSRLKISLLRGCEKNFPIQCTPEWVLLRSLRAISLVAGGDLFSIDQIFLEDHWHL
jgi:hypothetical protein